jgi:hypothetical protein
LANDLKDNLSQGSLPACVCGLRKMVSTLFDEEFWEGDIHPSAFSAKWTLKGDYARLRGLRFGDKKMRQSNGSTACSGEVCAVRRQEHAPHRDF